MTPGGLSRTEWFEWTAFGACVVVVIVGLVEWLARRLWDDENRDDDRGLR